MTCGPNRRSPRIIRWSVRRPHHLIRKPTRRLSGRGRTGRTRGGERQIWADDHFSRYELGRDDGYREWDRRAVFLVADDVGSLLVRVGTQFEDGQLGMVSGPARRSSTRGCRSPGRPPSSGSGRRVGSGVRRPPPPVPAGSPGRRSQRSRRALRPRPAPGAGTCRR